MSQAIDKLEDYRNLLEHRVVARFDTAVAGSDLGGMMACARIMAEFKRGETSLMQASTLSVVTLVTSRAVGASDEICGLTWSQHPWKQEYV